jgi:glycosyltransferase involved in cell wall biosynthesis
LVLPVRNERLHIARAFKAISEQTYPQELLEIVVVDGGSTDGTVEFVQAVARKDPRVRLLGGPGVNTPLAMNLGIEASSGALVAKIDGHGWINPEFLSVAQRVLNADSSAGCVGGVVRPVAETSVERAISIARFSRFGVGGGVYTVGARIQYVDSVQCGVYRRAALEDAGGFDPALVYGEDEELNFRVRSSGWRIVSHPEMTFNYQVRPTIRALYRQYFNYGRARVAVVRKHPRFLRAKHLAPAFTVLGLAAGTPALFASNTRLTGVVIVLSYAALVAAAAVYLSSSRRFWRPDLILRSLLALHIGYGVGTIRGVIDTLATRQVGSPDEMARAG